MNNNVGDVSMIRTTMRVLLTGALGHFGANYICEAEFELLIAIDMVDPKASNPVEAIVNSIPREKADNIIWIFSDMCSVDLVSLIEIHKITDVVHAAAYTHVDRSYETPMLYVENIRMTIHLLESLRTLKDKPHVTYFSTDEVYGDQQVATEDSPFLPTNPYSASKAAAEHMVHAWEKSYGLSVFTLRPNNMFGRFQPHKVIYRFSRMNPPVVFGDGSQVRDFVYVRDICNIVIAAQTNNVTGVFNIKAPLGNSISIVELARKISPGDQPVFAESRPYEDRRYIVDGSKLENHPLLPTPNSILEDYLRDVVSWCRQV